MEARKSSGKRTQIMKDHMNDDNISLVSYAPAACYISMIKDLIRYRVAFNATSMRFALKRDEIDTFEYLQDVVEIQDRDETSLIICEALLHRNYRDAFQIFMTKGFFQIIDLRAVLLGMIWISFNFFWDT